MVYRILADGILFLHLFFILFVVFGGLLMLRWRKAVWVHLPAVVWAIIVQWFVLICPLTPLEITLRNLGGEAGYEGDFIEHYLVSILYINVGPVIHTLIALFVAGLNIFVYWFVFSKSRRNETDI